FVIDLFLPSLMMMVQFALVRFMQMYWSLQEAYGSLQERTVDLEQTNRTLDQQVRDLSQLNLAGNRFSTTLEIDSLCQEVMSTFRSLWESPVCVIGVFDQETEQIQLLRQTGGASDEEVRLTLYDPGVVRSLQRAVESRQVVVEMNANRWFNCFVPLPLGARVWGALLLNSPRPREILQDREDFWSTLSGLAATALENSRLYNLATVDTLTKMYVRRYLQVTIDQEFKRARRFNHAISVLMIDIDQFKSFNDTFGHQQGDVVLREVSQVVRRSLRDIDIPARYGGEEFCVVLPETNADGALIVAERIRRNVEQLCVPRLNSPGEPLRVTVSIGGTAFPELNAENADQMIGVADAALYDAKRQGRNRTIISGG
ncbi:MAG TPA: GGDEF domain-containing protein, partial [Candidatus Ozemobacteraceae bacterium]|nr:GGDEF domain-containing protein [Candidatus Ozemobacteraceae bacterium]